MLRNWAEKWLKAWNSHDVDAVTAVVTDDIVYEDPSMFGQHIIGKPDFGPFCKCFGGPSPMLFSRSRAARIWHFSAPVLPFRIE
ncbi:snoaL-like domain protein [Mycobacterium kansasii 824]|nr:snoaL-like domain protein [Mycobacterium kansasii 824]